MEDFLYQGQEEEKKKYTLDDLNNAGDADDNGAPKGLWGAVANTAATGNTT